MENAIDTLVPFAKEIESRDDIQIIGGLGALALSRPDTVLDAMRSQYIPKEPLYISTKRANGSLRDVDIFVKSTNQSDVDDVTTMAQKLIKEKLAISVFGIHSQEDLGCQYHALFGLAGLRSCVSDRYQATNGQYIKSLYPFQVPLHERQLDPWKVVLNDTLTLPVPGPIETMLNYGTRSIGGVRPKDIPKLTNMARTIERHDLAGELNEEAYQGELELTRIIRSLGGTAFGQASPFYHEPQPNYSNAQLLSHPAFAYKGPYPEIVLAATKLKARAVHTAESQEKVVSFWQTYIEKYATSIVKNK